MTRGKYLGKKILVLGSNAGSVDIVQYAKSEGSFVAVADYLPKEQSEAKRYADEALQVSTADIDVLCEYVKSNEIDAVFAGISEFNLLKAMEVSEKCGLSFYCTREQWERVGTKHGFRKLCQEVGVPTPETFYVGRDLKAALASVTSYPAVVKPVDSGASRGVFICENPEELERVMHFSVEESNSGEIILERFFSGNEFTAHYVVSGGKASLLCIDNRYPVAVNEGRVTTIPAARVYPALFADEYVERVNGSLCRLCESIGLKNAVLFVQGFYDKTTGDFVLFEAGLRSAAELPNRLIRRALGKDYMAFLLDSMLLDDARYSGDSCDYKMGDSVCTCVSFVAKGGTVCKIVGLDEIKRTVDAIVETEVRYKEGDVMPSGDTLNQLALRFYLCCGSREEMAKDIALINETVDMLGSDGSSLVLKFEPTRLFGLE